MQNFPFGLVLLGYKKKHCKNIFEKVKTESIFPKTFFLTAFDREIIESIADIFTFNSCKTVSTIYRVVKRIIIKYDIISLYCCDI